MMDRTLTRLKWEDGAEINFQDTRMAFLLILTFFLLKWTVVGESLLTFAQFI